MEGGASTEPGIVMGPFLKDSRVLENEKRSGAVMKRDAQVSGCELCQHYFIRDEKLSYKIFSLLYCYQFYGSLRDDALRDTNLLSFCGQNLMKYVARTTFPMLFGR